MSEDVKELIESVVGGLIVAAAVLWLAVTL